MRRLVVAALVLCGCSEGAPIAMSFARASFYDAPFPSDDLVRPGHTIDLSRFPNPNHIDAINQAIALLEAEPRGFALSGAVYFRAGGAVDPASLDGNVVLVNIDRGERVPVDVAFLADGGPFGDKNLIAALPIQGVPMRPSEHYAAFVMRGVRDTHHRLLARAPEMRQILAAEKPAQLGDDAFAAYRAAVNTPFVRGSDAIAMTEFTTGDPTWQVGVVRDDALATHPIVLPSTLTPGLVYRDYCIFNGTFQVPVYQAGTPPYDKTGGGWIFDGARPTFDHLETSRIVVTIPRATMPASGWPTVVFVRTGGGGDNPLVDRGVSKGSTFDLPVVPGTGPAQELARVGFAGVQIDGPLGGIRNATNGNEDFLIFNVFNAAALRDNVRQSAMELSLLARALPSLTFDASACPGVVGASARVDGAHLALMGHSMGAWIAPLTLAVEPSYGAAVLSGAGGSYIANVMDKIMPLHVKPIMEIILDYNMDQRSLDAHDPALTLFQWAAEPSDPQVYGRAIVHSSTGRNVLMEQGIVDHYILPSIANATSLALGLDAAGPLYDATNAEEQMLGQVPLAQRLPLVGGKQLTLPLTGNAGGLTAVVVQHPGDGIEDGHEVMFQTEAPKHQYRCFLKSWLTGIPTVPADASADAPCP